MQTIPGPIALIKSSFVQYKANAKVFIEISLLPICIFILNSLFSNLQTFFNKNIFLTIPIAIILVILTVVAWIMQIVYPVVLIRKIDLINKNGDEDVKKVYKFGLKLFWSTLLISIIVWLITVPGLIIFVIPGILIALYSGYSIYFLAIEDKRGIKALSSSFYYVKGNLGTVFWAGFVFSVFLLLASAVFVGLMYGGVLLINGESLPSLAMLGKSAISIRTSTEVSLFIVSMILNILYFALVYPIMTIFTYQIYRGLKSSKTEPGETDLKKMNRWVVGLIVVGVFVAIVLTIGIFTVGVISGYRKAKINSEQSIGKVEKGNIEEHYVFPKIATPFPGHATGILQRDSIVDPLGYSIRIPQGWNLSDSTQDSTWVRPADDSLKMGLFIQKLEINKNVTNINNEQLVDEIVSQARKSDDTLRDVHYSLFELEGKNIYSFSGSSIYNNDKYISDYYIFIDGSDAYFLQIISIESRYSLAKELLQSAVSTFKLSK